MAIIERPAETTDALTPGTAPAPTAATNYGYLRRPVETTGWRSWAFTVDHKKIGIMYGAVAMFFFIIGGLEAGLIRLQLAGPDGTILSADKYNQMFTMHATTMVFLFVMPMAAAFANYFIPLQIGAFVRRIYFRLRGASCRDGLPFGDPMERTVEPHNVARERARFKQRE